MKNRNALYLLLSANAISGFAQGISMLAIPWYFASVLKDMGSFAYAYGITTLVSLIWNVYAGTLIDRYSRKRIFILLSLTSGMVLLAVALWGYINGSVSPLLILSVFAATIFNYNMHYPALYAFGQEITEKRHYGRINSYLEIQGQSTTILSGALAAVLLSGTKMGEEINLIGFVVKSPLTIEPWHIHEIFMMDAITYFISILLILMIRYVPQTTGEIETGNVWNRIRSGFRYLKENPLLFIFGNASFSIFVVLLVEVQLLLPLYVNNHLEAGADVYASSEIFYSIGALLAGVGIRWLFSSTHTVLSIIILMLVTVAGFYVCTFTRSNGIFYLFSFVIGITNAGTRVLRTTWLFHNIPNFIIGRANSVFSVINIILRTALILLFSLPFFAEGSNVRWTYFICGNFVLVSLLILVWKYKRLKE